MKVLVVAFSQVFLGLLAFKLWGVEISEIPLFNFILGWVVLVGGVTAVEKLL